MYIANKKNSSHNSDKEYYMKKYVCGPCAYVYDPAEEGTPFEDLAADWVCPVCGAGKDLFSPEE